MVIIGLTLIMNFLNVDYDSTNKYPYHKNQSYITKVIETKASDTRTENINKNTEIFQYKFDPVKDIKDNIKEKINKEKEDNSDDIEEETITLDYGLENIILYDSIMFNNEDIRIISKINDLYRKMHRAIRFNNKTDGNDNNNNILFNFGEEEDKIIDIKLYLGSIIYSNNNNWSLWINGNKLSNSNAELADDNINIYIEQVNNHYAKFIWNNMDIELLSPNWSDIININKDNWVYSKDKRFAYNPYTGQFTFILSSNQSLDLSTLEIIEGKLPEGYTTIGNNSKEADSPEDNNIINN